MKISITFGAVALSLSAVAVSCTTIARPSKGSGMTYLVGVAGGG